ncbi:MAG: 4Fe-4S binding protein [Candidatus Altiarchaeota archaeon]
MKKYLITYNPENADKPILAETILKTGVSVNILQANVDYREGIILVEVVGSERDEKKVIKFLEKSGLEVRKLKKEISKDDEACFDCGACVGVCPTEALMLNKKLELEIDFEKCIRCGICEEVCPVKALKVSND